jgi:hypothetical protein
MRLSEEELIVTTQNRIAWFGQARFQTIHSGLPPKSSDDLVSVVKLEHGGDPDQDISLIIGGADIFPEFRK